jgi:hypothetical protein
VRGRSSRLKVNYRTTQAIRKFADALQPTAESGNAEREERDALSLLTGPEPVLKGSASIADEIQALSAWIRDVLKDGVRETDIACSQRIDAASGGSWIVQVVWNGHESVHWTNDLFAPGLPDVNENYASSKSRTMHAPT